MIRAVLDTNVLISALINRHGPSRHIFKAWQEGNFELVTSLPLLQELDRLLRYDRLQRKYALGEDDIYAYILLLATQGTVVPMSLEISPTSRDPAADKFLACALVGRAQYVVSGDQDLLALGTFAGVRVVTPKHFASEILGG